MTARLNSVISETKTLTALGSYRELRHAVYVEKYAQNFPKKGLEPYNIGHTGQSISLNGKVPFMNFPKKLIFLRNRVGFRPLLFSESL